MKPIMFSGGVGTLDGSHVEKLTPTTGMVLTEAFQNASRNLKKKSRLLSLFFFL